MIEDTLYDESTGIIRAVLTNYETKQPIEGAIVTVTVLRANGDEVEAETWPADMPEQGDGVYEYSVEPGLLPARNSYLAKVVALKDGAQRTTWKPFRVDRDTS